MKTCCIVVIGHVDHGKTALVRALSGIETDRLPEEKARGLSITPGFAYRAYSSGILDFVDAPGHEDFVQAMISGATGARGVLVVISVAEGVGAQTLEHLRIAGLLGITSGVIAITKSDLLGPSEQAARLIEIREALSETPLANAQMVLCSALTGDGLDTLHGALQAFLPDATVAACPLQSFLPIDRVFSLPGRGTIVTGTLLGQDLAFGDAAVLQPAGRDVTIRGLQSRGTERDRIHVGERMAANLRGVAVSDITRGAVLCTGGAGARSDCIDAHLELLPTTTQALKHMQKVRVLFGTSSEVAQVRLFGGGQIAPAHFGNAQLRFQKPVVGYAGQRAVLRCLSPPETIGGAIFLDPQATPTKSGDKGRLRVLEAVQMGDAGNIAKALGKAQGGVAKLQDIVRLSRMTPDKVRVTLGDTFENLGADLISSSQDIETCKADVLKALAAYHARYPLRAMAPRTAVDPPAISAVLLRHVEAALLASGQIRRQDGKLAAIDHEPIARLSKSQHKKWTDIESAFRQGSLTPPPLESLLQSKADADLAELLIDSGRLISLRNVSLKQVLIFHTDTLTAAAAALCLAFPAPRRFTTGEARTVLATSRRIIVPILEHFDSRGLTIRNGDVRQMATVNLVPPSFPTC